MELTPWPFEVPPRSSALLPSPPGGRANRPAPSQHPAQVGPNRKNASMGHRVERIWNRVPTQVVRERPRSEVGLLLQSPTGEHLEQAIRLGFPASNNEAEYEAILSELDLALAISVSWLRVIDCDKQVLLSHPRQPVTAHVPLLAGRKDISDSKSPPTISDSRLQGDDGPATTLRTS
ncbi:hypothetical protein CK203_070653 [Vitis vinifera]|uniref:RNase H type-1 domain-containing protein n=1 Tax=Vitis vinifera TaxID=29760 RepID=A0A438C184_VITVI|nr:hypothetical protein CK203_070653 [Vitis vinifera]